MITGKIMLRIAFHILKLLTVAIPKTINMAIFMPTNPFIVIKNILKIVWDQLSLFTQNDILKKEIPYIKDPMIYNSNTIIPGMDE